MNLEKVLELILNNSDINIEYSNINGKERLIVNGEEFTEDTFDDTEIKQRIDAYKAKLEKLDDYIFGLVIDEAEHNHLNLYEMNRGLELEHYTEQDALYAENTILIMSGLIKAVLNREIKNLTSTLNEF